MTDVTLVGPFPSTVKPVRDGVYHVDAPGEQFTAYSLFANGKWHYCGPSPAVAARQGHKRSPILARWPFNWTGVAHD